MVKTYLTKLISTGCVFATSLFLAFLPLITSGGITQCKLGTYPISLSDLENDRINYAEIEEFRLKNKLDKVLLQISPNENATFQTKNDLRWILGTDHPTLHYDPMLSWNWNSSSLQRQFESTLKGSVVRFSNTPHSSTGKIVGLWEWSPTENGLKYLLPKREGISPMATAKKLIRHLTEGPVYGAMEKAKTLNLATTPSSFREFKLGSSELPDVSVVLNRPFQMNPDSPYTGKILAAYGKDSPHPANLLAIPMGIEFLLSPEELAEYRALIRPFHGQIGMGGDDIHPNILGRSKIGEKVEGDISVQRDRIQTGHILDYLDHGNGKVLYICGSMQRAAVGVGYGFQCDIGNRAAAQRGEGVPIQLDTEIRNPKLAELMGGKNVPTTNFHHGEVDPTTGIPKRWLTEIIAVGENNMVKAIEFIHPDHKVSRGIGTQFHPELLETQGERNLIKEIHNSWVNAKLITQQRGGVKGGGSCERLLKLF